MYSERHSSDRRISSKVLLASCFAFDSNRVRLFIINALSLLYFPSSLRLSLFCAICLPATSLAPVVSPIARKACASFVSELWTVVRLRAPFVFVRLSLMTVWSSSRDSSVFLLRRNLAIAAFISASQDHFYSVQRKVSKRTRSCCSLTSCDADDVSWLRNSFTHLLFLV